MIVLGRIEGPVGLGLSIACRVYSKPHRLVKLRRSKGLQPAVCDRPAARSARQRRHHQHRQYAFGRPAGALAPYDLVRIGEAIHLFRGLERDAPVL